MNRPRNQHPGSGRRSLPERRARERRVLWLGMLVSLAVHVVGVGLVGGWLEPESTHPSRRSDPAIADPPRGMRAVEIAVQTVPTTPEEPDEPDEPEPEPESESEPEPEAAPVVARADRERAAPADTLTARDRLRARVVDPRLWEPMVLLPTEPTIDDVEARVGAALELLSDSALAEAEAAMRARDWTVEDADGGRWGVSPGRIHLGTLTLPLPIWFPVDPEAAREARQWHELDHQLDRARILESFEERVQAIRERRDRERAERRAEENGGG